MEPGTTLEKLREPFIEKSVSGNRYLRAGVFQMDPESPGFAEWVGRFDSEDICRPLEPYLPDAAYLQWHTKQVFKGESAAEPS